MKKICLLLVMAILLTGCVYETLRSLYGDEWIDEHLTKSESNKDQSSDTDNSGQTPISIIDDQTIDTIVPSTSTSTSTSTTTTTTIQYTISFNANGGSGTMSNLTMNNSQAKNLPLCTFTPPLNKKFAYWTLEKNGDSYYQDGASVSFGVGNGSVVTLYAQWVELSQYSIFYYNTKNVYNPNPTTFFESESVTLQNLTAIGYVFNGWNDATTGKRVTGWTAGERTSNVTLGGDWTPHRYSVIYYSNGGIGQTERQTVSYGESFSLRENGFTRDGYTFIGWCTNSNGGGTGYNAGQTVSNLTDEDGGIVELWALWEKDGNVMTDDFNAVMSVNSDGSVNLRILDASPDLTKISYFVSNSGYDVNLDLSNCYELKSIIGGAFNHCTRLSSVILPNGVMNIGAGAFSYCEGLSSVVIPNGVKTIGNGSFFCCKKLKNITIPESVTSIDDNAFYSSGIKSIIILSKVISFSSKTFNACTNLESVTIYATEPADGSCESCNVNSNFRLYVPAKSVDLYKTKGYWCNFTTIYAIEE